MEKIPSFLIDHNKLLPGIYVSRIDDVGNEKVTTFDLRMKRPNVEPVVNIAPLHTIEHLAATYIRNNEEWKDKMLYFGPMGCRTGNYLLMKGELEPKDILNLIIDTFQFIVDFEGEIPGTKPRDCGNNLDHNLKVAQYESAIYVEILKNATDKNFVYPT